MRNFELAGRSPVHSTTGMAATSQPLATLTAIDVLRGGGNAMDAAVAACAVQCVIEPQSTGIGGDCFVLYAPSGAPSGASSGAPGGAPSGTPGGRGEVIAFNGSGAAPGAAEVGWYRDRGIEEIVQHSPHAVTVPGAVDAWSQLLRDHGTQDLGQVLQPAIRFARDGYPVSSKAHKDWSGLTGLIADDPTASALFAPGGRVPRVGARHRQPLLAETLTRIAEGGRDASYTGPVAEDMVSYLKSLGGLHTLDDFATHGGEYVTPIQTSYRGYDVYECPPNGQGIAALEMLNILSGLLPDVEGPLSAERLHYVVEAADIRGYLFVKYLHF